MFVEFLFDMIFVIFTGLIGHSSVENESVGGTGFGLRAIHSKNIVVNKRAVTAP